MLYHGPVRVPDNAQPGKATMLVEFPKGSKFRCFPTEIPVEILGSDPPNS